MRFSDGVPNCRQPRLWPVAAELGVEEAHHAGLEYIHAMGSMATHGNIKTSNILLSLTVDARVAEHGLAHLVGPAGALTAYRAPKVVADPRRVSQKTDVYSFGMLLLELLMEKAPTHAVLHDEGVDLPRWARSVVKEWTYEVFDMELLRHPVPEEEMVEMLRLAMDCTEPAPDQRPALPEIVARIEASTACATPARDSTRSSQTPELAAMAPRLEQRQRPRSPQEGEGDELDGGDGVCSKRDGMLYPGDLAFFRWYFTER